MIRCFDAHGFAMVIVQDVDIRKGTSVLESYTAIQRIRNFDSVGKWVIRAFTEFRVLRRYISNHHEPGSGKLIRDAERICQVKVDDHMIGENATFDSEGFRNRLQDHFAALMTCVQKVELELFEKEMTKLMLGTAVLNKDPLSFAIRLREQVGMGLISGGFNQFFDYTRSPTSISKAQRDISPRTPTSWYSTTPSASSSSTVWPKLG